MQLHISPCGIAIGFLTFSFMMLPGCEGDSEARGRAKELQLSVEKLEQEKANLNKKNSELQQTSTRLERELAAERGGKGADIEERQRQLDARRADLAHLAKVLTDREIAVQQREDRQTRAEREFYEKTNMTMVDIGEAKHVMAEYESMRSDKNAALATARNWLIAFWVSSGLCVAAVVFLTYKLAKHWGEWRSRVAACEVLSKALSPGLPPERARALVEASCQLAGVDASAIQRGKYLAEPSDDSND